MIIVMLGQEFCSYWLRVGVLVDDGLCGGG